MIKLSLPLITGEIKILEKSLPGLAEVKNPPSKEEIEILLKQIERNKWLSKYSYYIRFAKQVLYAIIDDCEEIPGQREVKFKLFDDTEYGLIENALALPGFLLSPSDAGLSLDDEIRRTHDYVLHKHLAKVDDPLKVINVGRNTYQIEKIIINSVKDDKAELIVETKKRKNEEHRMGDVDYFTQETVPILTGGYKSSRIKALTEFMRMFMNTNPESFTKKPEKMSDEDVHRLRATRALHTLVNALISSSEPETFKVYPASLIDDKTGLFNENVELIDLEKELFRTRTRYRTKTFYEVGITGEHTEAQEFNKDSFLEEMSPEDRSFYKNYLDHINTDYQLGKPLRLRIVSRIRNEKN